jgi:zinc D-Ala-D-Ala carboxypeptidase
MLACLATVLAWAGGCAAVPPRVATPERRATPAATPGPPAPAPVASPGPPAGATVAAAEPPVRLAWVNPARCLTSCASDPPGGLVRVGDGGERDARGRHRVARAAQPGLSELIDAARAAGHLVKISSAFRSYRDQARMFEATTEAGRAARPGHSEHQLGTAVDLRLPTSAAIAWLADHAPAFGFALSYPEGRQRLTGYRPEPWHVRFVGRELAEAIARNGATVEETLRARPELGEWGDCQDCPLPASRARCGAVTTAGFCQGSLLTWCYDGALATVDCAASRQRCGPSPDSGEPDCL